MLSRQPHCPQSPHAPRKGSLLAARVPKQRPPGIRHLPLAEVCCLPLPLLQHRHPALPFPQRRVALRQQPLRLCQSLRGGQWGGTSLSMKQK